MIPAVMPGEGDKADHRSQPISHGFGVLRQVNPWQVSYCGTNFNTLKFPLSRFFLTLTDTGKELLEGGGGGGGADARRHFVVI